MLDETPHLTLRLNRDHWISINSHFLLRIA